MKLFRATLLASSLFALAACGLLSAPITDPFGLDGEAIEVTVASAAEIRLQVASTATGSVGASIADSSDATGTLTNTVTFEAGVVVTKGDGNTNDYPVTITIQNVDVDVSIADNTLTVSDTGSITEDFTMTRVGDCDDTTTSCNYTMPVPAGVSISLAIGTVLNNDDTPNSVSADVTLALDSTPGLQGGDTLLFILEAEEGSGSL